MKESKNPEPLAATVLYCAALLAASYGIGFVVHVLFFRTLHTNTPGAFRFIIGAGIILALKIIRAIIVMIIRATLNAGSKRAASIMVPQTYAELARVHVRTPLDFAYLMLTTSYCERLSIRNGSYQLCELKNDKLFDANMLLFKAMFGRNPIKAESRNWMAVTICEAFNQRGAAGELSFRALRGMISPDILYADICMDERWLKCIDLLFPLRVAWVRKHCFCDSQYQKNSITQSGEQKLEK